MKKTSSAKKGKGMEAPDFRILLVGYSLDHSPVKVADLASGRSLSYPQPRLCENKFGGESVCYMGPGPTRRWEQIESYGPKFVENIVQGISRDLLVHAMFQLQSDAKRTGSNEGATGSFAPIGPIVAHVHDEVILETDPAVTAEEISLKMSITPPWAEGLLLRAEGYECNYYRKE